MVTINIAELEKAGGRAMFLATKREGILSGIVVDRESPAANLHLPEDIVVTQSGIYAVATGLKVALPETSFAMITPHPDLFGKTGRSLLMLGIPIILQPWVHDEIIIHLDITIDERLKEIFPPQEDGSITIPTGTKYALLVPVNMTDIFTFGADYWDNFEDLLRRVVRKDSKTYFFDGGGQ